MANQLANQLATQESKILDTLLSGKVPLTITGYLGTNLNLISEVLVPAPALAPTPPGPLPELAPISQPTAPPILTSLTKLFTVKDIWWEWKEGVAG